MKTKTTKRGGARNGSGRPKLGRVKVLMTLNPKTLRQLKRWSASRKIPAGYLIDELVEERRKS